MHKLNLSPSPLVLKSGHKVHVDYRLGVTRPLPDRIDVEINIEKKMFWSYMGVCGIIDKAAGKPFW